MKLISLNVWGGRVHDPFMAFLQKYAEVDIFCFQEVYDNAHGKDTIWEGANFDTFRDIKEMLSQHASFYHPHLGDWWGLALFCKEPIAVEEVNETYVHLYKGHDMAREVLGHTAKNLQYVRTRLNNKPLTIINFHGLWNGKGKTDCAERIAQSEKIAEFVGRLSGEVILCGDFNLLPDTESLRIIERTGLRNLVAEYGITSTRTSFYEKPEKFADYMFVSSGLEVQDFRVLHDEVSDHSPLFLEVT